MRNFKTGLKKDTKSFLCQIGVREEPTMFKQLEKIVIRKYARHIFALVMIFTLLVGLYVMQTVFPFTIEALLNMPAVVFPPYFILGVVSVWLLHRGDTSKLIKNNRDLDMQRLDCILIELPNHN